jgi:spore coat protein U-like protein
VRCPDPAILALAIALTPCGAGAAITCSASGASMGLGTYTGDSSAPTDSIGSFVVRCARDGGPSTVTVTMGIGPSVNGGSIANRQMRQAAGSDLLAYNLYRDVLRQNVWGQTTGVDTATRTVSIPNKASVDIPFSIYGRIPGLQSVYTGAYSDSLLVTFTF